MSIQELTAVIAPPSHPAEVPSPADWTTGESALGVTLPQDYKDLLASYGTGCLDDFLWVFSPSARNENVNLATQLAAERVSFAYLEERGNVELPYGLIPETPGLLPCGRTDNGDTIYWIVDGGPALWKIAIAAGRGEEFEVFDMSLSSFLAGVLSGRTRSSVFPDSFPSPRPSFKTAR